MWAAIKHFAIPVALFAALLIGIKFLPVSVSKKVAVPVAITGSIEGDIEAGADFFHVSTTDLFGTSSTPFGLSGNLTRPASTNGILVVKGCDKVVLNAAYLPRASNEFLIVLAEASMDEGKVYFPLSSKVAGTAEVDVYADGGTGMGAATSGIPFIFPGDKTTTAGTGVTSTLVELEQVPYTHMRFSARESPGVTTGTVWIQAACAR